jgi:hypothetical protein
MKPPQEERGRAERPRARAWSLAPLVLVAALLAGPAAAADGKRTVVLVRGAKVPEQLCAAVEAVLELPSTFLWGGCRTDDGQGVQADLLLRASIRPDGKSLELRVNGEPAVQLQEDGLDWDSGLRRAIYKSPGASKRGTLEVRSTEPGDDIERKTNVRVDGRWVGMLPVVLELPVGTYGLEVDSPGFQTWSKTIQVSPGANQPQLVDLQPEMGLLVIHLSPKVMGATIRVDGDAYTEGEIRLPAGEYRVEVSAPGYTSRTYPVYVSPRRRTRVPVRLEASVPGSPPPAGRQ